MVHGWSYAFPTQCRSDLVFLVRLGPRPLLMSVWSSLAPRADDIFLARRMLSHWHYLRAGIPLSLLFPLWHPKLGLERPSKTGCTRRLRSSSKSSSSWRTSVCVHPALAPSRAKKSHKFVEEGEISDTNLFRIQKVLLVPRGLVSVEAADTGER